MTDIERAFAFPGSGTLDSSVSAHHEPASPRQALESIVESAFTGAPVYVLFSGGRDSSAVLALAVLIARRLGADDPIPVTGQHPEAPRSSESEWQDLVLDHLKIKERVILEFRGEQSLLGDAARAGLARHGLLWPPALHLHGAIYRQLAPGIVLSGEGGDLAIEGRRITKLEEAVRKRWIRTSIREAIDLARVRKTQKQISDTILMASPWLTAEGRRLLPEVVRPLKEPLAWSRSLRAVVEARPAAMSRTNFAGVVHAHGHDPVNPFDDETFFSALEAAGGFWGFGGRTEMMRFLFSDLLPDAILSRTTKAAFNETRWTPVEREFAAAWTGSGVDEGLVDPERLRNEWLNDSPSPLSSVSLHAAWLADNDLPVVPDVA